MLPTSNPKPKAIGRAAEAARPVVFEHGPAGEPSDPLRPIGPERLRALREAIRNGTYPTESDVLGGLERLFARDD